MSLWNIAVFVSWVSGTFLNSLMVTVYIKDWRQGLSLGVCDQILFVMSISNVFLQFFTTLDGIFITFQIYNMLSVDIYLVILTINIFLYDTSFWNTAWLSIGYSLKLVSFSHGLLVSLQARFHSLIIHLMLGSTMISAVISVPFVFTTKVHFMTIQNSTSTYYQPELSVLYVYVHMIFGFCLPFFVTFICIGLSVVSLLEHVREFKKKTSQLSLSPQFQGLLRAACTLASRATLELSINLMMMSRLVSSFYVNGTIFGAVIWAFSMFYPSMQSSILILGNPKLKRRLMENQKPDRSVTECRHAS